MKRGARHALLLAIAATPVTAVEAGGIPQVERIDVPGHRAVTGVADAASEGTVTREQIENRPLLRVGEVLETVPGMIVTQHSGSGKANQFYLRGFNLDHGTDFRTTVLGMPVNMPTHAHGQGYTDVNFVIPELVSRIHYRKGTYAAAEGDFSAAGAAHIDYVSSLDRPILEATFGADRYRRLVGAGSMASSSGTWLAGVELQHEDGPWDLPQDLRKVSAVLRWSPPGDTGLDLSAMTYRNRWRSTDQVPERAVDEGLIGRFGHIDPTLGGRTWRHSLSAGWTGRSADSVTRATAYAIDYGLDLFSNFTYFLEDPERGDQFEQEDRRRVFGGSLVHARFGKWAGVDTTHEVGAEVRQDRIAKVGLHHTDRRERIGTVREDSVVQSSVGAWYSNTTSWAPWLRTTAGVRADAYRFRVASDLDANSGRAGAHLVNPKLAIAFGPFGGTELFANAGGGFHSNDARGATLRVDPGTRDPVDRVDPLVRAKGGELGLHSRLSPTLETTVTAWTLDIASELLFVGDAGTTEASRPSRRKGLEWASYWRPAKGLVVDADLALSRARFRDLDPAGDRIPGAIERAFSAGASYAEGPWSAGVRLRHFGARPLVEDNSVRSKGSFLANAQVGYRVTRDIRLRAEVLNLFDRKVPDIEYYYASRLASEGAPVAGLHTHPAEPRTLRLGLAFSL